MVKIYTAIGRFDTHVTQSKSGDFIKIPIVRAKGKVYALNEDELFMWSVAAWRFLLEEDLFSQFLQKRTEAESKSKVPPQAVLDTLIDKGLVACGEDILFKDAVYNLMGNLKVRPLKVPFFSLMGAAFHLIFVRRIPIQAVIKSLHRVQKPKKNARKILQLSKKFDLSTAELIQCFDSGYSSIYSVANLNTILKQGAAMSEGLYLEMRFSQARESVIAAITELYCAKRIVFELAI